MVEQDKQFLETVVKQIVGNPDDVVVDRAIDERGVLLTLKINPADMGYVIGRKGQTAQAIRTLLKIVGAKNNSRVNLKIYDPEEAIANQLVNLVRFGKKLILPLLTIWISKLSRQKKCRVKPALFCYNRIVVKILWNFI